MAERLETADQARKVAEALLRPGRAKPAVVVSIAGGRDEPFVDVTEVEGQLDGLCDTYVLTHGEASWAFAAALPDGRQVFGGASRVYATDLAWVQDQYASPLRFAWGPADGRRVAAQLVEDAFTAVYRDRQQGAPVAPGRVETTGTIRGVVGGRALVDLDHGGGLLPATIQPELVAPNVPAERMFVTGQTVSGLYDAEANRLDVETAARSPQDAFSQVGVGDALFAQVVKIGDKYVTVRLLPSCEVRLPLDEFESEPGIGRLVTVDEVLVVEVRDTADGVPIQVALLGPDVAELACPVSIFAGGPPWLVAEQLGAPPPPLAELPPTGTAEEPLDGTDIDPSDPAAAFLAEAAGMRRQLRTAEVELGSLKQQLASAKTAARTLKKELRELGRERDALRMGKASTGVRLFEDPWDQLRFDVYVTWAHRTSAGDKRERPWREPRCGPDFLETLESTEGVDRAKVVEVIADLVSGHADRLSGRAMHQLRSGPGGSDPVVTRVDGATCWRVSLQHKTPAARRLHVWRLPDGTIELSSVRVHDDMRP